MSQSDSQLAAFKAISQEAQSLLRMRQTSDVRDAMERILHITRVQINAKNAALRAADPQASAANQPPVSFQAKISQTPTEKRSRMMWIIVLALWAAVGYMGSQHFHEIFQQPPQAASN